MMKYIKTLKSILEPKKTGVKLISNHLRDKIAVIAPDNIIVNEAYAHDAEVLSYISILNSLYADNLKITYSNSAKIYNHYDSCNKNYLIDNASIVQKKVSEIITEAVTAQATDIHFVLQYPITQIMFRMIGELHLYKELSFDDGNLICSTLYNTMTQSAGTSFNPRSAQDGNMKSEFIHDELSGIRIASSPTQDKNYFMVLRLLPKQQDSVLDSLGYLPSQLHLIRNFISDHSGGITIIAGATGSGKSTSLQAMSKEILQINKGQLNFLTIEDPVEYPIITIDKETGVSYHARQIAINSVENTELKKTLYNNAVVAAMRQDPDIIMIGEMRDEATVDAALNLANTGHPVFTTLHARNVHSIIDRLETIGANKNLLLTDKMLTGLIAQKLVPTLCPYCKISLQENINLLDSELFTRLKLVFNNDLSQIFIKGAGCTPGSSYRCFNGYNGRTIIAEVLKPTTEYLELIRTNQPLQAKEYWLSQGGISMMNAGLIKVKQGLISPISLEINLEPIKCV